MPVNAQVSVLDITASLSDLCGAVRLNALYPVQIRDHTSTTRWTILHLDPQVGELGSAANRQVPTTRRRE